MVQWKRCRGNEMLGITCGGGGGYHFGRIFHHSFSGYASSSFFFPFFKVENSSSTLIPLFMTGSVHSGSANWDDCGRIFPDKLRVSSFPDMFPHYAWTAGIVSPLWLRCVKGVCEFACNLPTELLAEWPGSFTCHRSDTGLKRTRSKRQHTKLNMQKKIISRILSITSPALYQEAIPAPLQ